MIVKSKVVSSLQKNQDSPSLLDEKIMAGERPQAVYYKFGEICYVDLCLARLLAFVNVFVDSPWVDDVVKGLSQVPNVEEIYEVTGEFDIVSLVSASGIDEFRNILKDKIMKIKGVKSTVSSVVLHAHKGSRSAENGRGLLEGRKISA